MTQMIGINIVRIEMRKPTAESTMGLIL